MSRRWKTLDEALEMKRRPFPRPFLIVEECPGLESGVGNIGARIIFGTTPNPYPEGPAVFPHLTYIYNCHKDGMGPILTYWYFIWFKEQGYVSFDIRWIWKETGFIELDLDEWLKNFDPLKGLEAAVAALERVPEDERNRIMEKIANRRYIDEKQTELGEDVPF